VEQWKDRPLSRPFNIPSSRSGSIKNNESEIILLKKRIKELFGDGGDSVLTPAGVISMFGGTAAPTGWLLCNGAAVSREDYASLFEAISTAYGAGDGSTTFNVPDLELKFARGAGSGSAVGESTTTNTHGHTVESASHAHTHTLSHTHEISHTHDSGNYGGDTSNVGNHTHSTNTNSTGSSSTGTNTGNVSRGTNTTGNVAIAGAFHGHNTPSHNHTINEGGGGSHSHNSNVGGNSGNSSNSNTGNASTSDTGNASSENHSHNSTVVSHVPAYVAVNYIIKV
jgi:hypothetical protein